jgi:serine/threonine-protein kinase
MSDLVVQLKAALPGRYAIEREIGRGGMATVFLARDLKHERQVALKVLDPELGAVLGSERFLAEIRVTANLQHPNLLPLFDSGEASGLLFYVMPFVEGESLRSRLDREKQLPVDEAVRIASAVANALDYAHGHGVIHRDLKPENILLQAGQPVIADFGIALAVSKAGGARITQTGLSLGTPQYMSPEQATGDRVVDGRTDIYSLGAVVYEMLTGEPPHVGNTAQAIIAKLMTEEVRPVKVLRRNVPTHVDAAVRRALERLPADRFGTGHEFADALQGRAAATSRTSASPVPRRSAGDWRARLRDPVTLLLVAATITAIAVPREASRRAHGVVVSSVLPPPGMDFGEATSFGALAPDGSRFVFVTLGPRGETKLWLRRLDTLAAQPLAGTEGARAPFWSPDGRSVGFFVKDELLTMDVSGSAPRRLCDTPGAFGGSWGHSGVIVIASELGIRKGTVTGSECPVIIKRDSSGSSLQHPALLSDGRHALLTSFGVTPQIVAADLETGRTQVVLDQAIDPTMVGTTLLVYGSYGAEGESRLFARRFDPRTLQPQGEPVVLSEGVRTSGGIFSYAVSADGSTLVYVPGLGDNGEIRTDRSGRVIDTIASKGAWMHAWAHVHPWIAHTRNNGLTRFEMARRVDVPLRAAREMYFAGPAWSPQDSLLAYDECKEKSCTISAVRTADGRDTVLTRHDAKRAGRPTSWSPDGRYLVVTFIAQFHAENSRTWVYDTRERKLTQLITDPFATMEGSVSPDGRWLAYSSLESGAFEVVIRPFMRPGAPQRVSIAGGRQPYWRAGGRELLFQAPDGRVMVVDVQLGAHLTVGTPHALFAAPGWTRHNFFDSGTPFGVSSDGQQFTFRMSATSSAAVLVQNWRTLVK